MTDTPTPVPDPVSEVLARTRGTGSDHPETHASQIRHQIRGTRPTTQENP